MPVRIRSEVPDDVDAIDAVITSAFDRSDEAVLVRSLRADTSWVRGLVAVCDDSTDAGKIVGHIAFTRVLIDDHSGLALAPLAVAPDRQRQGIGSLLVEEGLRLARETGEGIVIVLGDPAYYSRFGFRAAREAHVTGPFGDIDEFQALALVEQPPAGRVSYPGPFEVV